MSAILICDDEAPLRELMRAAIGDGHEFLEAADGDEAIELARASKPDLLLLDIMLPGTSGLDVLRTIRRDGTLSGTRVVVVSAWDAESDRAAVEAEGADAFVPKPFLPEELAAVVDRILDGETG